MFRFRSIALDVFEPSKGKYLINEAQCIFGQSDPYQMLVDENPEDIYLKMVNGFLRKEILILMHLMIYD